MKKIFFFLLLISINTFCQTGGGGNTSIFRNITFLPTTITPTFVQPGIFYSSNESKFKAFENGVIKDLIGGGSTGVYGGNSPTTVTVGGLAAGTAISGLTYDAIIQSIVAPYVAPVFNSFSVSQTQTVEVGTTLNGSKTFTWNTTNNSGNIATIDLFDVTLGSNLLTATPNDGTENVTIVTTQLNSNGASQTWRAIGNNISPTGTINSTNYTSTARFLVWQGAAATVTNSAEIKALPASFFRTGGTTFTLNTGSTLTNFWVCLPPGVSITNVIDLDALNANITASYVLQSSINYLDAGSTGRAYVIYLMNIASPYSSNHRHQITIN